MALWPSQNNNCRVVSVFYRCRQITARQLDQKKEVAMKDCMGMTHLQFDFDGGSCLRLLERRGEIQGCIFGEEELENIFLENKAGKIIFADYSPEESIPGIEIVIYDHHKKSDIVDNKKGIEKTAFDIMLDSIGISGLDKSKIGKWRKLVMLGDKKSENDDMDITKALKSVHALFDDDMKVYNNWFVPLFDNFFDNEPDLGRAIEVFQDEISVFISGNSDSPLRTFLLRWSERLKDKEKISRSTQRNIVHFLAYMSEDIARKWIQLLLEGYDKEQTEFQECKKDFNRAKINFYGNTLIISAITKSSKFVQVARYMVFSKEKEVDPLIKEKIKDRNSPWLVILVNPRNKNFQVFVNGKKDIVHQIITEVVRAIRAEILLKRNRLISVLDELSEGGVIEGTDPLYFHKLETGYPSILWGSLKHPKVAAVEFGNTSAEIHSRLVEIVKLALDEDEYFADCNPTSCENCSINLWQLKKCERKRKEN